MLQGHGGGEREQAWAERSKRRRYPATAASMRRILALPRRQTDQLSSMSLISRILYEKLQKKIREGAVKFRKPRHFHDQVAQGASDH